MSPKPYQEQTYYELLEVTPSASDEDIREGLARAESMFGEDALATYTLLEPGEADRLRGQLQLAARTLLDEMSRDAYDRSLGSPPRPRPPRTAQPAAKVETSPKAEATPPPPLEAPAPIVVAEVPAAQEDSALEVPRGELALTVAAAEAPEVAAITVPTKLSAMRPKGMEIPVDAEFNGELLRQIRESRGQTVAQIADRTRIGKMHLENVEADRYDALPAAVYLRGILMNLARELRLDPLRVAKSYLALAQLGRKPS